MMRAFDQIWSSSGAFERVAKLILHAGTVKTGTTYLQKTLYQNRSVFERHGISYPFVFPPELNLPRYTNAKFLFDRSRDHEARELIGSIKSPNILFSEEGIFGNISILRHPALEEMPKRIIIYVRPTAELLSAWAAEMMEPYNVAHALFEDSSHIVSRCIRPTGETLSAVASEYEASIAQFMACVDEIGRENFTVRPFEKSAWVEGNLLNDFLSTLGLDASSILSDPDFRDPGPTNVSVSRKFCDLSRAIWLNLGRPNTLKVFNNHLINLVSAACVSGDNRHIVHTLSDTQIAKLTDRFEYFESYISETFLKGAPLFQKRYPHCYETERAAYLPINLREVELLTELIQLQQSLR